MRLTGLDENPPYIDEAATAANAMCLAQQGTSAFGEKWPLFVEVLVGNWEPPMIAYPSALIALIGDGGIGSFRLFAAITVIGTIVGIFFVGRELADDRVAWLAVILATLAPWSFVAGRLFWKCPLAPFFVVWGVYFFVSGVRERTGAALMVSAISFSLALYSYQSAWAQAPLMILVVMYFAWRSDPVRFLRTSFVFSAVVIVTCVPLAILVLSGGFMRRAAEVSVFSDGVFWGLARFVRNFALHLDPRFLFVSGDTNLRHGVGGAFGQFGWLGLLAFIFGIKSIIANGTSSLRYSALGWVALLGVVTGVLAAALSNEGLPHALRANGMWPFLALLGAWMLAQATNTIAVDRIMLVAAVIYLGLFSYHYYAVYPANSYRYFSADLVSLAESEDPARWRTIANRENPIVAQYYLMRHAGMSCAESIDFVSGKD